MKTKVFLNSIVIITILFSGIILNAQTPEFTVLAKSGDVFFKTRSSKDWEKIKIKDKILDGYKIKINSGGYLSLIHKNGGSVELKPDKTSEYTVAQLSKNIASNKTGLSKRFAQYIVNEITSSDDILSSKDYRENMQEVGAVERAFEGKVNTQGRIENISKGDKTTSQALDAAGKVVLGSDNKFIVARMPRASYIIDPNVEFTWYKSQEVKDYSFQITTSNDSVVYKKALNDTSFNLNFQNQKLNKDRCYYWSVSDANGDYKSEEFCIYWLSDKQSNLVKDTIKLIKSEVNQTNSPVEQIYLAAFFEDRNLMSMAEEAYRKAAQLAPNVKDYKLMYARYLRRIGLYEEANNIVK